MFIQVVTKRIYFKVNECDDVPGERCNAKTRSTMIAGSMKHEWSFHPCNGLTVEDSQFQVLENVATEKTTYGLWFMVYEIHFTLT